MIPVVRQFADIRRSAPVGLIVLALSLGTVAPATELTEAGNDSTGVGSADSTLASLPSDTAAAAAEQPIEAFELSEIDIWDTGVSPTAAVLMTPLFPGWGQLYTDGTWRAVLAFGAEMFYWSNMLQRDRKARRIRTHAETLPDGQRRDFYDALADEYWEQMRDFAWWSGGVLLIIALDAYVGAHLFEVEALLEL